MKPTQLHCEVWTWPEEKLVGVYAKPFNSDSGGDICSFKVGDNSARPEGEDLANMHFIAEAFNVYYETGKTPRQLLEDIRWLKILENEE
jgi:hypothetical protein